MKIIFKNLILFFALLISTQSAFGYVLTSGELNNILLSKLTKEKNEQLAQYNICDFKVRIYGLPQEKISTSDNILPKIEIISQNNSFLPSEYKRIIIRDVKGNIIKAFSINVQTKVYKEVLIADSLIQFNQELNFLNTRIEKKEVSKNLNSVFTQLPQGYVACRNFQKDSLITLNSVKKKSVISKNSIVDIKFLSNKGIEIKLQGKALKDGAIGETILVKSDKYNKTYNAVISSPQEVVVRI